MNMMTKLPPVVGVSLTFADAHAGTTGWLLCEQQPDGRHTVHIAHGELVGGVPLAQFTNRYLVDAFAGLVRPEQGFQLYEEVLDPANGAVESAFSVTAITVEAGLTTLLLIYERPQRLHSAGVSQKWKILLNDVQIFNLWELVQPSSRSTPSAVGWGSV